MMDPTKDPSQTCVIGCGGCGSQIAAFFDKIPSMLLHRPWHLYPIRCAAIDTAQNMDMILSKPPFNWHNREDIHILPTASDESVYRRIAEKKTVDREDSVYRSLQQRMRSGAGQFPFIGTLTGEEYLNQDNSIGKTLADRLISRKFTEGGLFIINSLTGGTGTGLAPLIPDFFSSFYIPRLILNLSIIPQITTEQQKIQFYPKNIVYGLYQLAQSKRVDAVILGDNEIMSRYYNCSTFPQYNNLLHEILTPFLLTSPGQFDYPNFCKHVDFTDWYRMLRLQRGLAECEFCALSYAVKSPPSGLSFKFKSSNDKKKYLTNWLDQLVDDALKMTTIGRIDIKKIKSAIGVLSGPPQFFDEILGQNSQYFTHVTNYTCQKATPNLLMACLSFPETKKVQLSLILTGVTSDKLEELYRTVIPPNELQIDGSLMDRIRHTSADCIEDLMLKEIRENLGIDPHSTQSRSKK
jgi:hypothetical protein